MQLSMNAYLYIYIYIYIYNMYIMFEVDLFWLTSSSSVLYQFAQSIAPVGKSCR